MSIISVISGTSQTSKVSQDDESKLDPSFAASEIVREKR